MSVVAERPSPVAARDPVVEAVSRLYTQIRPHIAEEDKTKYLLVDLNSGDWVIGPDDLALEDELLARQPDAHMVLLRADGTPSAYISSI